MRFRHPSGSVHHLAYASNVHPADDADGLIRQLHRFSAPLRNALDLNRLGVGLWVGAPALRALQEDGALRRALRGDLARLGLEVVTCNGFPYQGFHAPVVKHAVYSPSWSEPERAAYTLGLAELLAELLPDDVGDGSISTLPLGWRRGWDARRQEAARAALGAVAEGLAKLAARTGKRVRLGLEPEPGCVLETVEEAVAVLRELDASWIGLCLDACHLAVQFEDPASSLEVIRAAAVPMVKAQLACGLRVRCPASQEGRDLLAAFVEPRFLHQVRERTAEGIAGADDLEDAFGALPAEGEWRVHFHVPVHAGNEYTTQAQLVETLSALLSQPEPVTEHLELETYTWSVLPASQRPEDDRRLVAGLASELSWIRERVTTLGLRELP